MHRSPTANENAINNSGAGTSGNYWSNRPGSSTSAENNLREIRDSLGPFKAGAVPNVSRAMPGVFTAQNADGPSSSSGYSSNVSNNYQQQQNAFFHSGYTSINVKEAAPDSFIFSPGLQLQQQQAQQQTFLKSDMVKLRPAGSHHKEALIQIKQSLQPYSTTGHSPAGYNGAISNSIHNGGNTDTLSSESSTGTNGSASGDCGLQNGALHESILLDQLVQRGFDREAAWYALKLTQFRSLDHAIEILHKTNSSHVYSRNYETKAAESRKSSLDSGDSFLNQLDRMMLPLMSTAHQSRQYQNGPMAAAARSASSAYSSPFTSSGGVNRTPSPMAKPAVSSVMSNYISAIPTSLYNVNASSIPSTSSSSGVESASTVGGSVRSHISVNLQQNPSARFLPVDPLLVRERVTPVILQADKRQVEKPVAQSAVSPTIIAINNAKFGVESQQQQHRPPQQTKVISAHFDPQNLQAVRINVQPASEPGNGGHYFQYCLEADTTGGQKVSIQGRGDCAYDGGKLKDYQTEHASISYHHHVQQQQQQNRQPQFTRLTPASSSTMKLSSQRIVLSTPAFSNDVSEKPKLPLPDYSLAIAQLQNHHQQNPNFLPSQQLQKNQIQNYHHQIIIGGHAQHENALDEQQTILQQPGRSYGHPTGMPTQKRDSAASSSGESGVGNTVDVAYSGYDVSNAGQHPTATANSAILFNPLPPRSAFAKTVDCFSTVKDENRDPRSSPASSVSTEESENGVVQMNAEQPAVVRCESPLPITSAAPKDTNADECCSAGIKPCTPQAFKFFMEQHVENINKQYKERQNRLWELEREMAKAPFSAQIQCQMRSLLIQKESQYLRRKRQRMNASMFDKIKTIGVGAFGEVTLVRKIEEKKSDQKERVLLYAMKTLRKSEIIKKNQAAHVKAERDILSEANNEWVVKLYYSFQDREHLFFIMEYIPGGDMMALLIKKGIFEEQLARFYVAELVSAIESVHRLGFIHRDIKPDNILIDQNGHIKLTDFGLCTGLRWTHDWKYYAEKPKIPGHVHQDSFDLLQTKEPDAEYKVLEYRHQRQRRNAHSLVGTPNYIAPEVLTRTGHNKLCDWWSVGVILYEMVIGHPPFVADTPEQTQLKVINWRKTLHIPTDANLSPMVIDLISKLCCGVDERLGTEANATDIKRHSFFANIDWINLRKTPAPYKPEILHPMDTSNFDPVEPRQDAPPTNGADKTSKHDHAFYEFTFRRFFDCDGYGCPTLRATHTSRPQQKLETVFEPSQSFSAGCEGDANGSCSKSYDDAEEHILTPQCREKTYSRATTASPPLSQAPYRSPTAPTTAYGGTASGVSSSYTDDGGRNILRISTDDKNSADFFRQHMQNQQHWNNMRYVMQQNHNFMAANSYGIGGNTGNARNGPGETNNYVVYADESVEYSGPGRPDSDADDETSDSAVYV